MKRLRLIGWIAFLAAAIALLELANNHALALPTSSVDAWADWAQQTTLPTMLFALLLGLALVLAWYLVATTLLSAVADIVRVGSLRRLANLVTVPAIRRITAHAVAASVAGALVAPPAMATATDVPVLVHLPSVETPTPQPVPVSIESDAPEESFVTVRRGDNLWVLARRALESSWETPPSNRDVTHYWIRLLEANRDGLDHPDVVYAGQVIKLPEIPPATEAASS